MTYTFKLSRRIARLRAPLVASFLLPLFIGCSSTDSLEPSSGSPDAGLPDGTPGLATAFAGGIPIGTFDQPNSSFGERYNGALRVIWPEYMVSNLSAIKARGGKVALDFIGNQAYVRGADGHFSMSKWKARIDRYRNVNFSSYIEDGTVIGHYLIDEPNDPNNWSGEPISPATVEEMAKYSKQLWPGMATLVRAEPTYLAGWSGTYHYLDAAWAQYVSWKGAPDDYLRKHVASAQQQGLALVVGLNITKGGPNQSRLTASQLESWGSAMLNSSYPCAFLSWRYDDDHLDGSGIGAAMDLLRAKAESRGTKSCRSSSEEPAPAPPPSEPEPDPEPAPPPAPPAGGALPFGLYHLPLDQYSTRWTGAVYQASPTSLVSWLGRAESSGMRMMIMLAATGQSRNSDGTFSLTKWKAQVDRFRRVSFGSYVSDGTFYLHHLVDQPNCAACWGGRAIPWETVEEMARYSKSIWPSLPTSVRADPSQLADASFRWTYLDAGLALYNTRRGDLRTYLAREAAAAGREGLGLVAGLNVVDGAGGNTPPMTASQIEQFGTLLASEPSVCAVIGWKYESSYLRQSGIREAFDKVAAIAKGRSAASCVVS